MHKNFTASALSFPFQGIALNSSDILISYLPLAHCFERVMHVALYNGKFTAENKIEYVHLIFSTKSY
jgi:long-subunit acyl-CoA synthetase (AMP-forming)